MTKQFPTSAFARANIVPAFNSNRLRYSSRDALDNLLAEIAELGAMHDQNAPSLAEGQVWWRHLQGRAVSRPTPGGNYLEDYTVPSNSWI